MGEFSENLDDVIHRFNKNGAHSGVRVYTAKSIAVDIPSYWWLYGHQINIRYHRQPQTCRLCGKRGHRGYECPNRDRKNDKFVVVVNEQQYEVDANKDKNAGISKFGSYAGKLASERGATSVTRNPLQMQRGKGWADGGFRPGGFVPRFVQESVRQPGTATVADFLPKDDNSSRTVLKKNTANKWRKVSIVSKTKAQNKHEHLINNVNEILEQVQSMVGDNAFSDDDPKGVAIEVHQAMNDVKNMVCNIKDDNGKRLVFDDEEWEPVVDGSPENIWKLINYDIGLLSKCSQRIGAPCGSRLHTPAFKNIINGFISSLDNSRKRAAEQAKSSGSEDS